MYSYVYVYIYIYIYTYTHTFYTPPPAGSDFGGGCGRVRAETKKLPYTTPSGWWWWCIDIL